MKNLRTTHSLAPAKSAAAMFCPEPRPAGREPFLIGHDGHQTPCALDAKAETEFSQVPSQASWSSTTTGKSSKPVTLNASPSTDASAIVQSRSSAAAFILTRNSKSLEITRKQTVRPRRHCPSHARARAPENLLDPNKPSMSPEMPSHFTNCAKPSSYNGKLSWQTLTPRNTDLRIGPAGSSREYRANRIFPIKPW
jgi:hypothetical protein